MTHNEKVGHVFCQKSVFILMIVVAREFILCMYLVEVAVTIAVGLLYENNSSQTKIFADINSWLKTKVVDSCQTECLLAYDEM